MAAPQVTYAIDKDAALMIEPLDLMTAIYHRRSGITHIVAEPIPQILAVIGATPETADVIAERLAAVFDLGKDVDAATEIISARLEEMASLGLLGRHYA
ncbi:MAG: HPr-rel-A system PqqD family peptide chaperone [Pseudomonadota bacterium]